MKAKYDLEGVDFEPIEFNGKPPSISELMKSAYEGTVDLS